MPIGSQVHRFLGSVGGRQSSTLGSSSSRGKKVRSLGGRCSWFEALSPFYSVMAALKTPTDRRMRARWEGLGPGVTIWRLPHSS